MAEEQKKRRGENFDVFVSYRRSDGKDIARILNLAFKNAGYRCFLDYNDLEGGVFGKKLENAVLDAPVFVMVLTNDYFARCNEEGDWVRREIELALDNGKIIIPINYDGKVNCVPDYLDEKFRERVGCHNFATVYSNDAFEATFNDMLEKRIRKVMDSLQKQTDKAVVTVVSDADCTLLKNNEVIATLQAEEDNYILLGKGNHLLKAQSDEFPEISVRITKSIPEVPWEDFIEINLADKLPKKPIEPVEPPQPVIPQPSVVTPTPTIVPQVPNDFRELRTLTGHSDSVVSVAVSPDGKYLASGSDDDTVIIWDANNGQRLKTLKGHSTYVRSVSWSPDGKYLASGADDNTVIIWDAKSGEMLKTLKGHSKSVNSVSWSPDGNYLVSGANSWSSIQSFAELFIWDANNGVILKILKGHYGSINSVSWNADGSCLASGSNGGIVIIWDAKSGEKLKTLDGHFSTVYSVCWSPDGKYLASGSTDHTVKIWNAKSGQRIKTLEGHSEWVRSVCWSPNGKYLASGAMDYTIIIWDAESGQELKTLEGHSEWVRSVCWSPDGKYLASGSKDKTIKIWGVN